MIHFGNIDKNTFLKEYWQKKPLLIRQALPGFQSPISPEELAGLALEPDIESRIVVETPTETPSWHLKRGPFKPSVFKKLPATHWTLLVQGVDRIIPEIYHLLDEFDFIPSWRIDDVMISYATSNGSVGPHYDHYDVFLLQAQGAREWRLTSKDCHDENALADVPLRIMKNFDTEQCFTLEPGDMLYVPPQIGHYGISQSDDCMTYSFGYRSYTHQELIESLCDFRAEQSIKPSYYRDPDWSNIAAPAEITCTSWQQAQKSLEMLIQDESFMANWFAAFATRIDQAAEQLIPFPQEEALSSLQEFIIELQSAPALIKNACCRFAYFYAEKDLKLYINGVYWDTNNLQSEFVEYIANHRFFAHDVLNRFLAHKPHQEFLYELWKLNWITFLEE